MIEITNPERFGAFKIHHSGDIPLGWILIACVPTGTTQSDWRDGHNHTVVVPDVEYVIGQLRDDTIARLAGDNEALRDLNFTSDRERDEAIEKLKRTQQEAASWKGSFERTEKQLDLKNAEINRLRALETDLAKVRTHFGQRAFDEAVKAGT